MKVLTTSAVALLILTAQASSDARLLRECDRVPVIGDSGAVLFYNFEDPDCPAQFRSSDDTRTGLTLPSGDSEDRHNPPADDTLADDPPADDPPADDPPADDPPADDPPADDPPADDDEPRQGCNGRGCEAGSGGGNSEENEQSEQDGD